MEFNSFLPPSVFFSDHQEEIASCFNQKGYPGAVVSLLGREVKAVGEICAQGTLAVVKTISLPFFAVGVAGLSLAHCIQDFDTFEGATFANLALLTRDCAQHLLAVVSTIVFLVANLFVSFTASRSLSVSLSEGLIRESKGSDLLWTESKIGALCYQKIDWEQERVRTYADNDFSGSGEELLEEDYANPEKYAQGISDQVQEAAKSYSSEQLKRELRYCLDICFCLGKKRNPELISFWGKFLVLYHFESTHRQAPLQNRLLGYFCEAKNLMSLQKFGVRWVNLVKIMYFRRHFCTSRGFENTRLDPIFSHWKNEVLVPNNNHIGNPSHWGGAILSLNKVAKVPSRTLFGNGFL